MTIAEEDLALIKMLRLRLHACAELSGHEEQTVTMLKNFLAAYTSLELHDLPGGFYAAHREARQVFPSIALRADYDALPAPAGGAAHLCGHDGHSAALCGVALAMEGQTLGRNVFLLFQGAEETGEGAKDCLQLFELEKVERIYGAHNLPGFPFGTVLTRPGTFACASCGMTIRLSGAATHAAYPELGKSPAAAVGHLLGEVSERYGYDKNIHCFTTVIGTQLGEKAFGMAASEAELWLTLRAEEDAPLEAMKADILALAKAEAERYGLGFFHELQDVFPATVNDGECAETVLRACGGKPLDVPMRWSEDFGHYLQHCRGAFFGIGAGENQAPLHSSAYDYPNNLLKYTTESFINILANWE